MQKVRLEITLAQLIDLEMEIAGRSDGKAKGLLHHKIDISLKYELRKLLGQIKPQRELFFEMRNEIILKYAPDGNLPEFLPNNMPNPEYAICNNEIMQLAYQKVEIDFPRLELKDIDDKSEEYFPVLFDLIEMMEKIPKPDQVPT